ncbi:MAG: non-canonical purine NTP pyrophosphatase, partial [Clostridia bacterium]|nr:non-canonical purine NTP pyrophosphatase [Clostridia bacterium]
VIALILPDGSEYSFEGECNGYITNILKGENGFGFDPVFYYPPLDKTFAELSDEEKNSVSHRSAAIAKLSEFLKTL